MALPLERLRAALAVSCSIDRELGRGGKATVCLGRDSDLASLQALPRFQSVVAGM